MKASLYNYSTVLPNRTTLFFNFYTLALIGLEAADSSLAKRILSRPDLGWKESRALELKNLFINIGFIVGEEIDEIEILRGKHQKSRSDSNGLSLTIVPTLSCNFRCAYCYQEKCRERMNAEVEEALVEYVGKRMPGRRLLSVTWFGGEPLLELETMDRLSASFKHICETHQAEYTAGIVTNGYLLGSETTERLVRMDVKNAQVTLDGPPDIHDLRRPLAGGGKTFFPILHNIQEAAAKIQINIRMNVDEKNKNQIMDLLDILEQEGLKDRTGFYLGQTYAYTTVCQDVSGWCINDSDFSLLRLTTAVDMIERGFHSFAVPQSRDMYCMADVENAIAITPSGGMVKCWNEVGEPRAEVGHLFKPVTPLMAGNARRWQKRDPFRLDCGGCRLLPICMGGCPYLFGMTGRLHCHDWKPHLKEHLFFYYCLKKKNREIEIAQRFWRLVDLFKTADPGLDPANDINP